MYLKWLFLIDFLETIIRENRLTTLGFTLSSFFFKYTVFLIHQITTRMVSQLNYGEKSVGARCQVHECT